MQGNFNVGTALSNSSHTQPANLPQNTTLHCGRQGPQPCGNGFGSTSTASDFTFHVVRLPWGLFSGVSTDQSPILLSPSGSKWEGGSPDMSKTHC